MDRHQDKFQNILDQSFDENDAEKFLTGDEEALVNKSRAHFNFWGLAYQFLSHIIIVVSGKEIQL